MSVFSPLLKLFVAAALLLQLVACSTPDDGQRSGSIPVYGLDYKTDSKAGNTGANGTFEFVKGETITFSIAGIELVTLPAAGELELLDFSSQSLPGNEAELKAALEWNNVGDFQAALNKLHLLAAMDADKNFSNGFDVAAWSDVRFDYEPVFDASIGDFAYNQLYQMAMENSQLHNDIDLPLMVDFLLTLQGIAIPVSLETRSHSIEGLEGDQAEAVYSYEYDSSGNKIELTYDFDNDGHQERQYSYRYNSNGQEINRSKIYDDNSDGNVDKKIRFDFSYNLEGLVTENSIAYDHNADDSTDELHVWQYRYDSQQRRVSSTLSKYADQGVTLTYQQISQDGYSGDGLTRISEYTEDSDGDGEIDNSSENRYVFDEQGLLLRSYFARDDDHNDEADYIVETDISYTDHGQMLSYHFRRDSDANGQWDRQTKQAYLYDQDARLLERTVQVSKNGDDVYEKLDIYSYQYNAAGQAILHTHQRHDNHNLDQHVDYAYQYQYSFDLAGNMIEQIFSRSDDGDEKFEYISRALYENDSDGNRIKETQLYDENGNGAVDSSRVTSNSFEAKRRRTHSLLVSYSDELQTKSAIQETFWQYNEVGKRILYRVEQDENGNGVVDSVREVTSEYDASLNKIRELNVESQGGVMVSRYEYHYEYVQIAGGIAAIVNQYLDD